VELEGLTKVRMGECLALRNAHFVKKPQRIYERKRTTFLVEHVCSKKASEKKGGTWGWARPESEFLRLVRFEAGNLTGKEARSFLVRYGEPSINRTWTARRTPSDRFVRFSSG